MSDSETCGQIDEGQLTMWDRLSMVEVMLKCLLRPGMTDLQHEQMVDDIFDIADRIESKIKGYYER